MWWIDFSAAPSAADGIAESEFSDWGNTATGYGAFGVVDKGNITVRGGGLLTVP